MLSQLPKFEHPDLLSNAIPFADASIYRISENQALVQSVDFFTPIVDDPYLYGQIAAANSLSDIYAVGARPITAMNVVSFPMNCLEPDILVKILQGGADQVAAAGAVLAGGHSIEDEEPKYGLSVTGLVDPDKMLTACGAGRGDLLYLTKPVGTGILATALKGEVLSECGMALAIDGMATLNKAASEAMLAAGASACTDVTGFGLIGHGCELAEASGVGLRIDLNALPLYPQAQDMAAIGLVPVGAHRNKKHYARQLLGAERSDPILLDLLCDPQTSGGLLIAVSAERSELLEQELRQRSVPVYRIGEVTDEHPGIMELI